MRVFTADWVVPSPGRSIARGAVAVEGGRIAAVGTVDELLAGAKAGGVERIDLRGCVLLPGLVNAHTHLEYTAWRDLLAGRPFFAWIRELTRLKYEVLAHEDLLASARLGALEALLGGTTTLAEQTDAGTSLTALRESGIRSICYLEVFGHRDADASSALEGLDRRLRSATAERGARTLLGVTPHSPYTAGPSLISAVAKKAASEDLPLAIHVAESAAEVSFVGSGEGVIAEHWRGRGFAWEPPGTSPVAYLDGLGFWAARPPVQAVHLVHATGADWDLLGDRGASAALCPRSNARLGVGSAPLGAAAVSRTPVGLGTDSAASGGTLSLLDEARSVLDAPDGIGPETLLEWITVGAARSLGLDGLVGSLEPGKAADLAAFRIDGPAKRQVHDPVEALMRRARTGAEMVAVDGEILVRAGVPTPACGLDPGVVLEEAEAVGDRLRKAVLQDDG